MLSAPNSPLPPLIGFFTQSSQFQIWKANTYSIQLNEIKLGLTVSRSSTWISKFYDPTDSEYKFHKTRIKNWLSIVFKLESPWLETYSHNQNTMFNFQNEKSLILIYKVLEQS